MKSLSLSLSHTHTLSLFLTHSLSHTHTHTHSLTHSLSLSRWQFVCSSPLHRQDGEFGLCVWVEWGKTIDSGAWVRTSPLAPLSTRWHSWLWDWPLWYTHSTLWCPRALEERERENRETEGEREREKLRNWKSVSEKLRNCKRVGESQSQRVREKLSGWDCWGVFFLDLETLGAAISLKPLLDYFKNNLNTLSVTTDRGFVFPISNSHSFPKNRSSFLSYFPISRSLWLVPVFVFGLDTMRDVSPSMATAIFTEIGQVLQVSFRSNSF